MIKLNGIQFKFRKTGGKTPRQSVPVRLSRNCRVQKKQNSCTDLDVQSGDGTDQRRNPGKVVVRKWPLRIPRNLWIDYVMSKYVFQNCGASRSKGWSSMGGEETAVDDNITSSHFGPPRAQVLVPAYPFRANGACKSCFVHALGRR
jgi:hypothetical protein